METGAQLGGKDLIAFRGRVITNTTEVSTGWWFQALAADAKDSWVKICEQFNNTYGPAATLFVEPQVILERTQGVDETVRQYAREMATRFSLVGADQETARKTFIKGLKTVLKPHVILKAPVAIQEAEKCALEAEQLFALNKVAMQETCQEIFCTPK